MKNVIALQKDSELFIANCARSFIQSFNSENSCRKIRAFPRFPLWAFAPESFSEESRIKTALIGDAEVFKKDEGEIYEFYFPLSIETEDGQGFELKIIFAEVESEKGGDFSMVKKLDFQKKFPQNFPLSIKSFRIGRAVIEENSWKLFDEKWLRCFP